MNNLTKLTIRNIAKLARNAHIPSPDIFLYPIPQKKKQEIGSIKYP